VIGSPRKRLLIALAFLLPNLAGFLVFTAGPILASLWMSVTDLQLTRHNELSDTPVRFVGFENYARILWGDESHLFWDYFGNTLYRMLGIPIGIAGSLALALMLNAETTPRTEHETMTQPHVNEPPAGAVEPGAVEDAVAEIGLGHRAEPGDGAGGGEADRLAGRHVRRVDQAPALRRAEGVHQPCDR